MCIDYRALNALLVRDNHPLPIIEDQLNLLEGKKYFTVLDLKDGFHQLRVAEDSIKYTSFVTPSGQYKYLRLPFGLKTPPAQLTRYVTKVSKSMIDDGEVVDYIDNFMIATVTIDEHVNILKKVFRLLVRNNLSLRVDKCKFLYTQIEYLGYLVSQKGIRPTERGIEAVRDFPIPTRVREVPSFVRLCSFFQKFIENFFIYAKPL